MAREQDHPHPTDAFGLPEGLLAAVVAALLLVGAFALHVFATPMPPAERWGSLTAFSLLALGLTLPGCAALYDGLGRVVRRDWRALVALLAVAPTLYAAYALAVRELTAVGLLSAILFTAVPALAFGLARDRRQPALADAVALTYLGLALGLQLVPRLTLPQQGGLVGFFSFTLAPLLLLLFAARGWPGLGFTWRLSGRELRDALAAGLLASVLAVGASTLLYGARPAGGPPTAGTFILSVISSYFFVALPMELLLRGGAQNGLARALAGRAGPRAPWLALAAATALSALAGAAPGGWPAGPLAGGIAGLAAGWSYIRTGKLTAAALASGLVVLGTSLV